MKKEIGYRIREIRNNKNLSMADFGKLFSPPASRGVVSNWENNYNYPNEARLKKIAELGGISTKFLLYSDDNEWRIKAMLESEGFKVNPEFLGYISAIIDFSDHRLSRDEILDYYKKYTKGRTVTNIVISDGLNESKSDEMKLVELLNLKIGHLGASIEADWSEGHLWLETPLGSTDLTIDQLKEMSTEINDFTAFKIRQLIEK